MTKMKHHRETLFTKLRNFFTSLTVEPASMLAWLTINSTAAAYPTWLKNKCTVMYMDEVPLNSTLVEFHDHIQDHAAWWNNMIRLGSAPIMIFTLPAMGALADRYGRTVSILLGIAVLIFNKWTDMLTFSTSVNMPLWLFVATSIPAGLLGTYTQAYIAAQAFLVDASPTAESTSTRLTRLGLFRQLGSLLGFIGSSFLMNYVGTIMWTAIAMMAATMGFIYTLFRVPMLQPRRLNCKVRQEAGIFVFGETACENEQVQLKTPMQLLRFMGSQYKHIWRVLTTKRGTITTSIIWLLVVQASLSTLSGQNAIQLINQYVTFDPLLWTADDLAYFTLTTYLVSITGISFATYFLQQRLNISNTTLLMVTTASQIAAILPVAFAVQTWIMYLYSFCGLFMGLLIPLTVAALAEHVQSDEMGTFISGIDIVVTITVVCGTLAFTPIYLHTQNSFRGAIFLIIAVITTGSLGILTITKFLEKRIKSDDPKTVV